MMEKLFALLVIVAITWFVYTKINMLLDNDTKLKILDIPRPITDVSKTQLCGFNPETFTRGKLLSYDGRPITSDDKIYCVDCNRVYHQDTGKDFCRRFEYIAQDNQDADVNSYVCSEDLVTEFDCPKELKSLRQT